MFIHDVMWKRAK